MYVILEEKIKNFEYDDDLNMIPNFSKHQSGTLNASHSRMSHLRSNGTMRRTPPVRLILDEVHIHRLKLNSHNQNVIHMDAKRTKVTDEKQQQLLEKMITYYCKANNIDYIQGMNEVSAPNV